MNLLVYFRAVFASATKKEKNMSKYIFALTASLLILIIFFEACGPSDEQKRVTLSKRIGHETCDDISIISSNIVGSFISELFNQGGEGNITNINTGDLGRIPEYWCDCYTYFVVSDLSEKFTYKELVEIKKDKAKQMMVLEKIVEVHQEDLEMCIVASTNKKFKNYDDFAKELDIRFANEK